jgi:hypothetical protein
VQELDKLGAVHRVLRGLHAAREDARLQEKLRRRLEGIFDPLGTGLAGGTDQGLLVLFYAIQSAVSVFFLLLLLFFYLVEVERQVLLPLFDVLFLSLGVEALGVFEVRKCFLKAFNLRAVASLRHINIIQCQAPKAGIQGRRRALEVLWRGAQHLVCVLP